MNKKTEKTVKNANKAINKNKKPLIIGGICAGAAVVAGVIIKGIKGMKQSAKAQHEVDKANFAAAKSEAKANFEENRGSNTYAKAKADAKKNWDDTHMSPSERAAADQAKRDEQIRDANKRKAEADARYEAAKVNK